MTKMVYKASRSTKHYCLDIEESTTGGVFMMNRNTSLCWSKVNIDVLNTFKGSMISKVEVPFCLVTREV